MRTIVYIDGFNLYRNLVKKRHHLKWLNLKLFVEQVLGPKNHIIKVNYYTSHVLGISDSTEIKRQKKYFDALETVDEIAVHKGSFKKEEYFAEIVCPPVFCPELKDKLPKSLPDKVKIKVRKPREKKSDVNLACHLLRDSFQGNFDMAAVLSNDADLTEAIRLATQELGKTVVLLAPVTKPIKPNKELCEVASSTLQVKTEHLENAQFCNIIEDSDGKQVEKPPEWNKEFSKK